MSLRVNISLGDVFPVRIVDGFAGDSSRCHVMQFVNQFVSKGKWFSNILNIRHNTSVNMWPHLATPSAFP